MTRTLNPNARGSLLPGGVDQLDERERRAWIAAFNDAVERGENSVYGAVQAAWLELLRQRKEREDGMARDRHLRPRDASAVVAQIANDMLRRDPTLTFAEVRTAIEKVKPGIFKDIALTERPSERQPVETPSDIVLRETRDVMQQHNVSFREALDVVRAAQPHLVDAVGAQWARERISD